MKESTRLLGFLLLLLLFAGGGFVFGRKTAPKSQESQVIVKVDTITKIDTLAVKTPVFRYSYIHDTVRTYFQTVYHDTVQVDVPIERRVYEEDSLYRAVVSGWQPSLDSLTIYPTTTTITIREKVETSRWSLGVTAGPSVLLMPHGEIKGGFGLTAGISYRF